MSDDLTKPSRFPYLAALLCAACAGATVWTWMTYSYAWSTTPEDVADRFEQRHAARLKLPNRTRRGTCDFAELIQPYLAVRGTISMDYYRMGETVDGHFSLSGQEQFARGDLNVVLAADAKVGDFGVERTYLGRLRCVKGAGGIGREPCASVMLDTAASRFTGASIAGLVVGAMGVFVFTVALRHWLGERRKFRERDEGA